MYQKIGEQQGEEFALNGLGIVYRSIGKYQKAITFHEQAIDMAKARDDRFTESVFLGNLGIAYRYLGAYQQAIVFYHKQLDITRGG